VTCTRCFFQPRKAKFDEFTNEVPKEFTKLATADFANIYAPHMIERTGPTLFNTGGPYVSYFDPLSGLVYCS